MIAGITYVPGYLDQGTHDQLFSAVDQQRWQTCTAAGSRLTQRFNGVLQRTAGQGSVPHVGLRMAQPLGSVAVAAETQSRSTGKSPGFALSGNVLQITAR